MYICIEYKIRTQNLAYFHGSSNQFNCLLPIEKLSNIILMLFNTYRKLNIYRSFNGKKYVKRVLGRKNYKNA